MRANTHISPLKIGVNLQQIDLEELSSYLEVSDTDTDEFVEKWEEKLISTARTFTIKILGLSALGGFLGTLIIGYRGKKKLILGSVIGFLVLALILAGTVFSYDYMAFMNPEFEGALESFPWMMGVIEESLTKIGELGEQLEIISVNLFNLFQRIENVGTLGTIDGEYQILHVSDIHNNPAAYDFIFQISSSFGADMIIDTGDITDYGTPVEAELASRIYELGIPYIFIPGNHDSPQVVERMEQIPNVIILKEDIVEVMGFNIAGIEDPSAVSTEMAVKNEETLMEYTTRLEDVIDSSGVVPDIVGVHHPMIAKEFFSKIPVVLTGHTHQQNIEIKENSTLINAGTTGAAGIRGFQVDEDVPFSLALLHMSEEKELLAVDLIEITHLEGGYRVERVIPGNIDIVAEES